jgi:hydrogenase maturation protease
MSTVVIGLGNPLLTDDGVGPRVVRALRARVEAADGAVLEEMSVGGLRLVETLIGHERAFIVDALATRPCRPGTLRELTLDDLTATRNSACLHDASLVVALQLMRALGVEMPREIRIWGIEAEALEDFGEALTAEVQAALPGVVEVILQALRRQPS